MQPLYLLATIHPDMAKADEVERILRRMMAATLAEPGCELYDLVVDLEDPQTWFMMEKWSSREAWEAHMVSAHNVEGNAQLHGLLRAPTQLRFWESKPHVG